ncbi:MAG: hypothetical protein AB7I13_00245 [Vicinamibacterales bacterium]
MARIRSVKPDFHTDRRLATDLTREQRLFYQGMWNFADDEGRMVADPRGLLGEIFRYEKDLDETWVEELLVRLVVTDRAVLYEVGGEQICQLTKFSKHQKISHPTPSRLPPPPKKMASTLGWLSVKYSGAIPGVSPEVLRPDVEVEVEVEVEQGSGSREQGGGSREAPESAVTGGATEPPGPPADQPDGSDQPDGLDGMLEAYPAAEQALDRIEFPNGRAHCEATLRHRFLYADPDPGMGDPVVKGVPLQERQQLVAIALLEFPSPWDRPLFTGYVRRLRDQGARLQVTPVNAQAAASSIVSKPYRVLDRNGNEIDPKTGQPVDPRPTLAVVDGGAGEPPHEHDATKLTAQLVKTLGAKPVTSDEPEVRDPAVIAQREAERARQLEKARALERRPSA